MTRAWVAGLALVSVVSSVVGQNQGPAVNDDLVGLWGSEAVLGPQVRGEFLLSRGIGTWTARIGGFEVSAPAMGDSIRIELPGGQGRFQGRQGRQSVRGFWIQPSGASYSFASPLTLTPAGPNIWRGQVTPHEERFSLYLKVDRQTDGSLRGSFFNPEARWNGRAPWFKVGRDGENVTLTDPATNRVRFVQPYDSGQGKIMMDFGVPFALTRRTPDQAVGFYPRPLATGPYRYRPPANRSDGLPTASAASVGVDSTKLDDLVQWIVATDPTGDRVPRIHSVLVARRGVLVLEEYFYGMSADRPHDVRSAGKTLTSIMVGAAMRLGVPIGPSTRVASLFPADSAALAAFPRRANLTLGHLLTHSSGLACDDNSDESPGNEDRMQSQSEQPDWVRYALALPMVADPGSRYAYCSAGINLAGGMVSRATRRWLPEFFDTEIARPLGFGEYHWNLAPDGQGYAAGGGYIRPRDLLKLGLLYLNRGVWNGRRLVSEAWVTESTGHQIDVSPESSDGFAWHRYQLSHGGRQYREYEASGNGGQFVIVIPDLELVVVFTAGNYNQYPVWRTFRDQLVPQYLIAAIGPDPRRRR